MYIFSVRSVHLLKIIKIREAISSYAGSTIEVVCRRSLVLSRRKLTNDSPI